METVAMYWEPQIKTYGFQVVKNLSLYKYVVPADLAVQWDLAVERTGAGPDRFHLLSAQLSKTSNIELLVLCEPEQGASPGRRAKSTIPEATGCRCRVITPVELLFFQGPHFGDRFGIADFTYQALKEQADLLIAAVFSCASIYLILPEGAADETKTRLAAAFRIPR